MRHLTHTNLLARLRQLAPWLLAWGLIEVVIWQVHERGHIEAQQRLSLRSSEARAVLEGELNTSIYLTVGLSTYIQSQRGHIDEAGLLPWMRTLVEQGRHIRNIGLAPGNRIRFMYPLAGNEAAIGLYYPDIPEQWPAVQQMILTRKPVLAGPVVLRQGGSGLIYRTPVFIDGQYWGLASTVLDADSLLSVLQQLAKQSGVRMSLAHLDPSQPVAAGSIFWSTAPTDRDDQQLAVDVPLPGTRWRLTVSQADDHRATWAIRGIGGLLLLIAALVLERSRRHRQHVDRLKNEFLSIVSHELRTPLSAIIGSLKLLESGTLGPLTNPARHLLSIANNNAARLNQLVNDLLDMERLSTGKLSLVMQRQPLRPLLERALANNSAYAAQFDITLNPAADALDRAEAVFVNVDALRLQQILTNVLGNAAKFSPRGSTVLLEVERLPAKVRVAVRDQGPGIPEHFRSAIFEKFSQADASDTREKGGSGLGLAIAHALAGQMGGQLDFTCPPEGGTRFTLDLPRFDSL